MLLISILGLILVFFLMVSLYVYKKNIHIWLLNYLSRNTKSFFSKKTNDSVKDIMFLFVDHFELAGKEDRLNAWMNEYPKLVNKFKDWDGVKPQHTWFSALDLIDEHELSQIKKLVDNGLGEVELHWHHSHKSSEEFINDFNEGMAVFHKYGFMLPYRKGEHSCFSFIHGNWSLNNARGEKFCGIENEIKILKDLGCYGDYTFPALFTDSQPKYVNQISYTNENVLGNGYFTAREAEVGKPQKDSEFMIMQGPLAINYKDWRHKWHPTIEDGDINKNHTQGSKSRIDCWIRQNIHVKNNPNWVFVKVFCHGAQDYKSLTSEAMLDMYKYLESKYNDGEKYRLHYVTARESYNIIKAAEEGKEGNPNEYRDYLIPHPSKRKI